MKKSLVILAKGFCMGSADVIPGVSGGTMAFILGIYYDLIASIRSFDLIWIKSLLRFDLTQAISRPNLPFLIPLGTGILCAMLVFTRVIPLPELLLTYPEPIYGLFFGLIASSIFILLGEMDHFSVNQWLFLIAGTVAGWFTFNLIPVETPNAAWFVFLAGALSICAMLLPGISGSFVLLILNKYSYVFNAIGYFKFSILVPFALGALTGLLAFSRLLSWLLLHFYKQTVTFIIGLLIASLWVIWPFQDRVYETVRGKEKLIHSVPVLPVEFNNLVILAAVLAVAGIAAVLVLHAAAGQRSAD